jgi:hypothetical protein
MSDNQQNWPKARQATEAKPKNGVVNQKGAQMPFCRKASCGVAFVRNLRGSFRRTPSGGNPNSSDEGTLIKKGGLR